MTVKHISDGNPREKKIGADTITIIQIRHLRYFYYAYILGGAFCVRPGYLLPG